MIMLIMGCTPENVLVYKSCTMHGKSVLRS